eukprot:TRINITY_DN18369_c0_g1_i1.p1 TRINITY_DN18369_c0_g1~~TRINITY_DN18369_c0_g1_i1.p1  ORF type:complete len:155 (+),score=31.63 TRINITY_DN18369_c0_g1_i1:14-478(+)
MALFRSLQLNTSLRAFPLLLQPARFSSAGKSIDRTLQINKEEREKERDQHRTGRAWRANELRLKSFEDLHSLWYVLVRERDRLLSLREREGKRNVPNYQSIGKVRQSMARIKTVLSERTIEFKKIQVLIKDHINTEKGTIKKRSTKNEQITAEK